MTLGKGRLTWNANERRSDRYGSVYLLASGDSTTPDFSIAPLVIPTELINRTGQLIAQVVETRNSTHIGDLFHGVFPSTPAVGAKITLGKGRLFTSTFSGDEPGSLITVVGLKPADDRDTMWLDIRALYQAHEQTVILQFIPHEDPA